MTHTVSYTDREGRAVTLFGELQFPAAGGKRPAVILCHGFNGHYTDFPLECRELTSRGFVTYAFDFCGAQAGGRSAGRGAGAYTPFTMSEDLRAVLEHIRGLERVDEDRVFLFGGSQGGLVTGLTACREDVRDKIAAIAMYFPAMNIPDDWRKAPVRETALMGYSVGEAYIRSVRDLDPYGVIGGFEGDVCILWGDRDPIVRKETIDKTVNAYGPERVELTVLPGAGHGFAGEALDAAVRTLCAFYEARV